MVETSPDRNASAQKEAPPFADASLPMSVDELIRCGGVSRLERKAAYRAIAQERSFWLQVLETWLDQCDSKDEMAYLKGEIRRLRRLTGIPASLERRRAQVRNRVRRWRHKRRTSPATMMETSSSCPRA
jgi:hypothetical protein